jgi:hypothetical protein
MAEFIKTEGFRTFSRGGRSDVTGNGASSFSENELATKFNVSRSRSRASRMRGRGLRIGGTGRDLVFTRTCSATARFQFRQSENEGFEFRVQRLWK